MAGTSKLARYRYIRTLGAGGMGIVSLAQDTMLARPVALKRMSAMGGDQGLLRLRREALLGASVSHPNLVSIYDVVDSEDGDVVIVMEYVEGETLRQALSRRERLATAEVLRVLEGAAAGLDAIHEQGIVHRDVKPANLLLGSDGSVKVADLGIASVSDQTRLTSAGSVLGSLSYMAPEQLRDAPATPAIDIYALAAVAWEALAGEKARKESNVVALAYALSTQPPPALSDVWPAAPAEADALLSAAMAQEPAQRPGSAGELVARLRGALEPPAPVPARPAQPPPAPEPEPPPTATAIGAAPGTRARGRAVLPVLALAAVAAVAAAAVLASGGSSPHRPAHASAKSRSSASTARTRTSSSTAASGSPATTQSGSTRTPGSASAAPAAGTPGAAVQSFYRLAAAHRYTDAWALADPALQSQLGGYQSFQHTFAADRSITFDSTRLVNHSASAATVSVKTTSVQTSGTQHCTGTVALRSGGSSAAWLVHQIQINCV
ncbi:MAG: serine/threonine-protein kinase [Solirubrobacteraceae bacterium]